MFSGCVLSPGFLKDQSSGCSQRVVLDQDCGSLPALSMDTYTNIQLLSVSNRTLSCWLLSNMFWVELSLRIVVMAAPTPLAYGHGSQWALSSLVPPQTTSSFNKFSSGSGRACLNVFTMTEHFPILAYMLVSCSTLLRSWNDSTYSATFIQHFILTFILTDYDAVKLIVSDNFSL